MFSSENVRMLLAKATMKIVTDDKGVQHRMAECALVLEPFTLALARELGDEIASHLFTADGNIRPELESASLDPRVPQQAITVRETPDSAPTVTLRQVDVFGLSVGRQSSEVMVWIKATVKVRFSLADRAHRDFLARGFGLTLCWTFEAEQNRLGDIGQSFVDSMRQGMTGDKPGIDSVTFTGPDGKGVRITKDDIQDVGGAR